MALVTAIPMPLPNPQRQPTRGPRNTSFIYMIRRIARKNAKSFGKIKEAIINKVQRTFDHPLEIVQCLRENKKPTFTAPEPEPIEGDTAEARSLSAERGKMIFHEKYKWHMRKQDEFDINFSKTFAMIWETYCTAELRREIKEMPDWDQGTNKVMDNPLRLLEK